MFTCSNWVRLNFSRYPRQPNAIASVEEVHRFSIRVSRSRQVSHALCRKHAGSDRMIALIFLIGAANIVIIAMRSFGLIRLPNIPLIRLATSRKFLLVTIMTPIDRLEFLFCIDESIVWRCTLHCRHDRRWLDDIPSSRLVSAFPMESSTEHIIRLLIWQTLDFSIWIHVDVAITATVSIGISTIGRTLCFRPHFHVITLIFWS